MFGVSLKSWILDVFKIKMLYTFDHVGHYKSFLPLIEVYNNNIILYSASFVSK